MADFSWTCNSANWRFCNGIGTGWVFQAAGGFAVRRKKLAGIFPDSELCNNLDSANGYTVAYPLSPQVTKQKPTE